jgi:two-component system, LytTR family, response regulator
MKALIIDEEEKARDLLNKLLEETHCFNEIRMADSVKSVIAELKHFEPDLIFLDIQMSEKGGFELSKIFRKT